MVKFIYIVIPFLLVANLIHRYLPMDIDMQWQIYFISEKLAVILILLSSMQKNTRESLYIFKLTLIIYIFELLMEVIGTNVKGTSLSDFYICVLIASTIYIVYFYLRTKWIRDYLKN